MDVDVDNEFDGKFLDQFRSMGTTDRDVLIAEFQNVLGNNINPDMCAFFLDMNNWNLQNAVCSYCDFEQPSSSLPCMSLLADTTIAEGESVAPSTTFCKSWRIKNSGNERWPPGCHIRFCNGHNMSVIERKMVDPLGPGMVQEVSVEMTSPSNYGTFQGLWRLCSPTGMFFGDSLNVHIEVKDGGLLGLTQQLSRIGDHQGHISMVAGDLPDSSAIHHHQSHPLSSTPLQEQNSLQDPTKLKFQSSNIPAQSEEDTEMS